MDNIQKQLIAKLGEEFANIFPLQYVSNILDGATGETLTILLSRYNHIFIPFTGEKDITRAAVPPIMRRKGLYITYITPNSEIITEYFKGNKTEVNNEDWVKDKNWGTNLTSDNFVPITLPDGSVTAEKLSQEVLDLIGQGFKGNIENHPDGEDLTSTELATVGNTKYKVLKFADRNYTQDGMGYVILRKNKTFTEQVTKSNTIYEIRYNFDLDGKTVNIPDNCVLKFEGGTIINGELRGKILNDFISPEWFGAKGDNNHDDTLAIQRAVNLANSAPCRKVLLSEGIHKITNTIYIPSMFEFSSTLNNSNRQWGKQNIMQYNSNADIFQLYTETGSLKNISLHDLYIGYEDLDALEANGISIYSDITKNRTDILQNSNFENLYILGCKYGIYIDSIGYLGFSINNFNKCTFYGNKVGIYFNCQSGSDGRNAWINLNKFDTCVFDNNSLGGIYIKARSIQDFILDSCNIQRTGNGYNYEDYISLGCYAIKCQAMLGNISIKNGYYEQNYPRRIGTPTDNETLYNNIVIPKDINSIKSSTFYFEGVECYVENNVLASSYKFYVLNGAWGLYAKDNDLYFPSIGYEDPKSLIYINGVSSNGNYNTLNVKELKQYSNQNTTSFNSVYEVKEGVIESLMTLDVDVSRLNYRIKRTNNLYLDDVNLYISNTGNDNNNGLFKAFPKLTWKSIFTINLRNKEIVNVLDNVSTGAFISGGNAVITSKDIIINGNDKDLTLIDNSWIITNSKLVFNNCNFKLSLNSVNYVMFKLYGKGSIQFNNCNFDTTLINIVSTLCGFYLDSNYEVIFYNCSFNNTLASNLFSYYLTKNIQDNKSTVSFINSNIITGYYYSANNEDGTLSNKIKIVSNKEAINGVNYIYKIINDIDLAGETLTIPANCTLDFQGGSFSNGTIVGNNTKIIAGLQKIFNNDIILTGTWNVEESYPEWFGAVGDGVTNDTIALTKCINYFTITSLSARTYITDQIDNIPSFRTIKGCGKKSIIQANPSMELTNNYLLRTKDGGSGIIFSDFVLLGGSNSTEANYKIGGILLRSTSNDVNDQWDTRNIIQNVEIKNCYAASIYIGTYQRENKIVNCFISHTTNVGINCNGTDNMIIGCTVAGSHQEGIIINGNNRIDSCKCFGCGLSTTKTGKYALKLIGNKCNVSNVELQQNNYGGCIIQGNSNYVQVTCDNNGSGTTSTVIGCSVVGSYNTVIVTSYNFSFHDDNYERYFVSTNFNTVGNNIIINGTPLANNKMATLSPWSIDNICNNILWNGFNLTQARETPFNKYLVPNKYTTNGTGTFIQNNCGLAFRIASATAINADVLSYSFSIPNAIMIDNNGCFSVKARFHKDSDVNSIIYPVVRIITTYTNSSGSSITRTDQNVVVNLLDNKDSLDVYALTSYHYLDDKPVSISSIIVEFVVMSKSIASGLAINAYFDDIRIGATTAGDKIAFLNEKGTTSARPTLALVSAGFKYYDTTLNKYIMSNGTAWVNLDGTALA